MRSAVVVGAGVGGLAVAGALARTGWRVTLLERNDRLRGDSAALMIWPNGIRALHALGLGGGLGTIGTAAPSRGRSGGLIATGNTGASRCRRLGTRMLRCSSLGLRRGRMGRTGRGVRLPAMARGIFFIRCCTRRGSHRRRNRWAAVMGSNCATSTSPPGRSWPARRRPHRSTRPGVPPPERISSVARSRTAFTGSSSSPASKMTMTS